MKVLLAFSVLVLASSPNSERIPYQQQNAQDHLRDRIIQALKNARETVITNGKALSQDRKTEGKVQGFELQKVIAGVNQGQQKLVEGLGGPELAGLRLYVEKYYPIASADNLSTNSSQQFGPLVDPKSKDDAFKKALAFIATLRFKLGGLGMQESDLAVDLTVVSQPSEALFSLAAVSGESRQTRTNNTMSNVFRGVYEYTITKTNFKTGKGEINLIDEEGLSIQCRLVGSNENGDSFCRQFKAP